MNDQKKQTVIESYVDGWDGFMEDLERDINIWFIYNGKMYDFEYFSRGPSRRQERKMRKRGEKPKYEGFFAVFNCKWDEKDKCWGSVDPAVYVPAERKYDILECELDGKKIKDIMYECEFYAKW